MPAACLSALTGFLGAYGAAAAAPVEGTWKFERSADYYGRTPPNKPPRFPTLVIGAKDIRLSESCTVRFTENKYFFSDVFQPLSKEGGNAKQLDAFLTKHFNLALEKNKSVYSLVPSANECEDPVMEFFQVGDRVLIPVGFTFYSYVKADQQTAPAAAAGSAAAAAGAAAAGTAAKPDAVPALIAGYKLSLLPMDVDRYYQQCLPKILDPKGKPRTTEKCAPNYFPYVADPKKGDALMNVIGTHNYGKWGQEYTQGFSPPYVQKAPATFLVFPPLKDVVLVRVDDFEVVKNEARDIMSGVYLSIVGGKVVDQIAGCHVNRDYVCLEEGRPVAKLKENGKFQPL